MSKRTDKEWEVEATIEIRTSFFCDTKEEAEKNAHDYLSELCQAYIPIAVPTVTRLRTYIVIQRIEPQESEVQDADSN